MGSVDWITEEELSEYSGQHADEIRKAANAAGVQTSNLRGLPGVALYPWDWANEKFHQYQWTGPLGTDQPTKRAVAKRPATRATKKPATAAAPEPATGKPAAKRRSKKITTQATKRAAAISGSDDGATVEGDGTTVIDAYQLGLAMPKGESRAMTRFEQLNRKPRHELVQLAAELGIEIASDWDESAIANAIDKAEQVKLLLMRPKDELLNIARTLGLTVGNRIANLTLAMRIVAENDRQEKEKAAVQAASNVTPLRRVTATVRRNGKVINGVAFSHK